MKLSLCTAISMGFFGLTLFLGSPHAGAWHSESAATQEAGPSKAALIKLLKTLYPLLEKKEFAAASPYFVLPPDFKPEMLDGMIQRREISMDGINRLEQEAKFGTAAEAFGSERAGHFASRGSVDVDKCYGFNHETQAATAEVIAFWDGSRFKLVRLDDVGKLKPMGPSETAAPTTSESTSEVLAQRKSAVESNPNDVAARANYAMALYQSRDLPGAWSQLMQARKIQSDHGGIAKGMSVLLTEFESAGLFAVGTSSAKIESVLGVPDTKVDLGSRKRWVYLFLGIDFNSDRVHEIVDLRGATESLFHPTEIISVDLDGRGWVCGLRKKNQRYSSAYYYLPGESSTRWTEQVEIERILDGTNSGSMEKIGQLIIQQMKARHPESMHQILSTDENSLIIVFELPESPNYEKRHQLVRLMKGPVDVHRFAYTIKTDQPSKEMQSKWLAIMKSASLKDVKTNKD